MGRPPCARPGISRSVGAPRSPACPVLHLCSFEPTSCSLPQPHAPQAGQLGCLQPPSSSTTAPQPLSQCREAPRAAHTRSASTGSCPVINNPPSVSLALIIQEHTPALHCCCSCVSGGTSCFRKPPAWLSAGSDTARLSEGPSPRQDWDAAGLVPRPEQLGRGRSTPGPLGASFLSASLTAQPSRQDRCLLQDWANTDCNSIQPVVAGSTEHPHPNRPLQYFGTQNNMVQCPRSSTVQGEEPQEETGQALHVLLLT